jgi:HAD superfamily hydrolase (TIGR01509 family)
MDGVLLDSEPLHHAVLNSVLFATDGYTVPDAEYEDFIGTTTERMFALLTGRHHFRLSIPEYIERYDAAILRALRQPLTPLPGVVPLLERIAAIGLPLAVASSSKRSWVKTTVRSLGLDEYFAVMISGDDVTHGKPDPAIYALTAARLDVPAERCLAIEDAPHGVASAIGAGMAVLGVRTPYTAQLTLDGVLRTVDSLAELDLADLEGVLDRL